MGTLGGRWGDKDENQRIPRVEVPKDVQFIGAHFDEECQMEFVIKNVGRATVDFEFVDEPYRRPTPWLRINPKKGKVKPNQTKTVYLTVHVNETNVRDVMEADNKLEDILIFHVTRGSDTFVTVTGSYLPSCFGNKIENLVHYLKPIRFCEQQPSNKVLCIPKELWRMVDYIYKHGTKSPNLFQRETARHEIQEIRECLDVGKEFDKRLTVESMANCMLQFLQSTIDPVFPASIAAGLQSRSSLTSFCRNALMSLPLSHYNVFIYIIAFLREILKCQQTHATGFLDRLSILFSQALMHADIDIERKENNKPFLIIRHFLQ